jgi:hypothetical protein
MHVEDQKLHVNLFPKNPERELKPQVNMSIAMCGGWLSTLLSMENFIIFHL